MANLLVLFPLGSEVRQFGHSGVIGKLLDAGWKVTVAAKIADQDLTDQLDPRARVVPLPKSRLSFMYHRIAAVLDKVHTRRERAIGRTGWQYKAYVPKNWKERAIFLAEDCVATVASLSTTLCNVAGAYEMALLSKSLTPEWSQLLQETKPDIVLVNLSKAPGLLPVLAAARKSGAGTVLLYHTWKDVAAAGRLSPVFDRFGVWNPAMGLELLRQNPWLDKKVVKVVGCTHFDCVDRDDLLIKEDDFRRQLQVGPDSPILLYIASAPWLVPEEERYIRLIRQAILSGRLPTSTRIVVRTNPMDNSTCLLEALKGDSPEVQVAKPDWRWDPEINWGFQRSSDLKFYNSLLRYASVCIGIPSTATVECSIVDLPTVNIGFDLPGPPCSMGKVRKFWDADFYDLVRDNGAAEIAGDPEELVAKIVSAIRNRADKKANRRAFVSAQLGVQPHFAAASSVDLLQELVHLKRSNPLVGS